MSTMTPETLSPLCKGLFDFMARLDYEGLHWDEAEALEALAPVIELEQARQRVETAGLCPNCMTERVLLKHCRRCGKAEVAALAPDPDP